MHMHVHVACSSLVISFIGHAKDKEVFTMQ